VIGVATPYHKIIELRVRGHRVGVEGSDRPTPFYRFQRDAHGQELDTTLVQPMKKLFATNSVCVDYFVKLPIGGFLHHGWFYSIEFSIHGNVGMMRGGMVFAVDGCHGIGAEKRAVKSQDRIGFTKGSENHIAHADFFNGYGRAIRQSHKGSRKEARSHY